MVGHKRGLILVLHDVSHLRQLEQVRKGLVANVSHELKTPVTAIKGFIEALSEGAVESQHDTRRFLDIVARQSAWRQRFKLIRLTL